eukprot:COSAG04_NODE_19744_length_409_cov_0.822581_1_plen_61_part_10
MMQGVRAPVSEDVVAAGRRRLKTIGQCALIVVCVLVLVAGMRCFLDAGHRKANVGVDTCCT